MAIFRPNIENNAPVQSIRFLRFVKKKHKFVNPNLKLLL